MKFAFLNREKPEPDANATWADVRALLSSLGLLARKRPFGDRDATLFVSSDGECLLTIETDNGSEMRGKGRNPFEAALDLALSAGVMRDKIVAMTARPPR